MPRRPVALLAALAMCAARAAAQDAPVATLRHERAPGAQRCVDEAELRELVAARLGRDPFVDQAPLAVSVTIAPRARGYVATIDLVRADGEPGHREIEGTRTDCRDLADALALALSVAVDPASLVRRPPSTESAAPPADVGPADVGPADVGPPDVGPPAGARTDVEAAPTAESPGVADGATTDMATPTDTATATATPGLPGSDVVAGPDAPAVVARFGATLLLSYEIAPDVSGGIALRGGLGIDAFSIDLELRAELPTVHRVEGGSARGAPFVATLVPCGHLDVVALCGVAAAGAFWGEGVDAPEARSAVGPWVSVGGRGGVEVPLGSGLDLLLFAQLDVPLLGAGLAIGATRVWETPPVALSLGAGLGGRAR